MNKLTFTQYTIQEEFDCGCLFYTSPIKENGIFGTLRYNHNRGIFINLNTPIKFEEGMKFYANCEDFNHYVIYDVRQRLIIEDNLDDDKGTNYFDADFMIMSASFPSSFPLKDTFTSISFELMNLWDWYSLPNYKFKKLKTRLSISLKIQKPIKIKTSSNREITFSNIPVEKPTKKKGFEIIPKPKISINYSQKKSFSELFSSAKELRTLIQLLIGDYSAFTEILLFDDKRQFRVYYADANSERNLKWGTSSVFLGLPQIKLSLAKTIEKWEKINSKISQVVDILIMEYNNQGLNPEVRFLNTARAVETFHRRLRNNSKQDKKLSQLKKNTIDSIPAKYKQKFKDALSHIEGLNLRGIITNLYSEINEQTKINLNMDADWIDKFVQSRNYYTHFGRKTTKVLEGEKLLDLSNRIRTLLHVLIALELGITEKRINDNIWHLILM